jgi:hypothetical protein
VEEEEDDMAHSLLIIDGARHGLTEGAVDRAPAKRPEGS